MSAIQQLLTDHIDIWTAADTEKKSGRGRSSGNAASVYGIKKLRELILELAVRGKLVPQDSNDEPASELLKRIRVEKTKLIAEGKIKTDEPAPLITEKEKPFSLPQRWEWIRFGAALISRDAERIPVSSDERQFRKGEYDYYGASGVIDKIDKYLFDKPLLLIGEDGANLINRSTPIAFIARGKYWVNNHAHVLDGISEDFLRYIELYINAIDLVPYVTGTAQPKMNQSKMNSIVLGLPSEAEQHRIVTKVDELMALCDQLEAQHNNATEAHEKLVSHLLGTLTQSQNAADFSASWQRIAAHFDTLFTTEASIDAVKQTLLQLAVMGKLVPQDPKDEPASELLKRIQAEKAKLVAEGKIKKDIPLELITDEEKSFALPDGWQWVRLQSVIDVRDGTHDSPKKAEGPDTYPLVTSKDFFEGGINFDTARRISEADHLEISKRSLVEKYDILFSMIGGNIGNQVIVEDDRPFSVKNVALFKYYDRNLTIPFFIKKYMENLAISLQSTAIGGAQPFVALGALRNLVMALPPLSEQHRIVTKIDELMALCDQLKSRINDANLLQQKLADVMVEQAVA